MENNSQEYKDIVISDDHVSYNHDIIRGGSTINFRVLQNFTKKIEHRNDVICRKIIDSARSKKVQF